MLSPLLLRQTPVARVFLPSLHPFEIVLYDVFAISSTQLESPKAKSYADAVLFGSNRGVCCGVSHMTTFPTM